MSRRIGDQEWHCRNTRLVVRKGMLVGLQTWLLQMIVKIEPLEYKVQKVQHKYGFYPLDWTRTRTL